MVACVLFGLQNTVPAARKIQRIDHDSKTADGRGRVAHDRMICISGDDFVEVLLAMLSPSYLP